MRRHASISFPPNRLTTERRRFSFLFSSSNQRIHRDFSQPLLQPRLRLRFPLCSLPCLRNRPRRIVKVHRSTPVPVPCAQVSHREMATISACAIYLANSSLRITASKTQALSRIV